MRLLLIGSTLGLLVACGDTAPSANRGVGFDDYDSYSQQQQRREAALNTSVRASLPQDATAQGNEAQIIAAETTTALGGNSAQSNSGISRENDFEVVSERETIESDAERLERQRQQYAVVKPTALPSRDQAGGRPNIVEYALSAQNSVGQQIYRRGGLNRENRSIRACAQYPSSDVAQEDFLASGGPQRDRKNLDPDGDGFACSWDPAPFQRSVRN
ncbi:hypothetical protein [Parasulfitobacter algicola]|uniref:Excalibur calcium-binding domain-containing protein n=1 Tax=Parasulfitobacter algicola TaxID=2614809 RepID=A0ABX2ILC4_9RHOB|nr:hypothetical protein [Sulfitobacter algicola]NSX53195.1 hypothetical protein [Sulfitobacter algicola]